MAFQPRLFVIEIRQRDGTWKPLLSRGGEPIAVPEKSKFYADLVFWALTPPSTRGMRFTEQKEATS